MVKLFNTRDYFLILVNITNTLCNTRVITTSSAGLKETKLQLNAKKCKEFVIFSAFKINKSGILEDSFNGH